MPPATKYLPSGLKATALGLSFVAGRLLNNAPVSAAQIVIIRSESLNTPAELLAVAMYWLSGLMAIAQKLPLLSERVLALLLLVRSITVAVLPSNEAVNLPSKD